MKYSASQRASTRVIPFCSVRENLKRPFLRPFKKDIHDTPSFKFRIKTAYWWNRLMKSTTKLQLTLWILERWMLFLVSFLLAINRLMKCSNRWLKQVIEPLGRPLNPFWVTPFNVTGKYQQGLVYPQVFFEISGPIIQLHVRYFDLL